MRNMLFVSHLLTFDAPQTEILFYVLSMRSVERSTPHGGGVYSGLGV